MENIIGYFLIFCLWAFIRLFMLNKTQKSGIVQSLVDRFKRQKIVIFSDFHGISAVKAMQLRRALKKEDAEYTVAKKTLLARALESAGSAFSAKELNGEIGVAFGYGDQAAPARVLTKFGKENDTFKILAGFCGSRILSTQDVIALARLPSREVLLLQAAAALSAPLRGFAGALQGNIRNLVVVLSRVKK